MFPSKTSIVQDDAIIVMLMPKKLRDAGRSVVVKVGASPSLS
jgi:hypothetical protein